MINMAPIEQATRLLADVNAKAQGTEKKEKVAQARKELDQGIGQILNDELRSVIFDSYEATKVKVSKFEICPSVVNDGGGTTSGSIDVFKDGSLLYQPYNPANKTKGEYLNRDQFFDHMGATTVEGVEKLAEAIKSATIKLLEERTEIVKNKDNPLD